MSILSITPSPPSPPSPPPPVAGRAHTPDNVDPTEAEALESLPLLMIRPWIDPVVDDRGHDPRSINRHGHVGQRLTGQSVSLIIRRAASRANIEVSHLSGHSLRAGFATTAAAHGASEASIARQTGHKSMDVLRKYIRLGDIFARNAVIDLGL